MSFQDKWFRWHHKELKPGQLYSSNNAYIYSAEAASVGLFVDRKLLFSCFLQSVNDYGFTRHPDQQSPAISHDEILGIAYLLGSNFVFRNEAAKWEKNHWQICDLPFFEPKPWRKLDWIKVIKAYWDIYQLDKQYTKTNGKAGLQARHAVRIYPEVYPIAFHLNGWKRYFFKRHLAIKPTIYETIHFFLAKLITCFSSSISSLRLLGFQLKMIKNKTILEKVIDIIFKLRHNLKVVASKEYAVNHPILTKL